VRRGPIEAVAGADGAYTLCVPVGETTVEVAAHGYGAMTVTLAVTGKLRRNFELSPEGVLVGRAVRADDGTPVAGAIVAVEASGESFPGMVGVGGAMARAATDDDGRFRIEGLLPGRRQVSAAADGLRMSTMDVLVEAGEAGEPVELALAPAATVRGVVLDEKKQPVAGATVSISEPNPMWTRMADSLSGISQDDGSFVIERVVAGEYEASVRPYERANRARQHTFEVPANGLDGLELVVTRGSTVSGVVTLGHRPLGGARVYLRGGGEQVQSESDGRFRIRGVEPGDHGIYAEAIQEGAFTNGPVVHVDAGKDVSGITLELDLAGTISGVVVDQRGAPVAGAYLSISLVDGRDVGEATTGDDGAFKIGALSGGGDYEVSIMASKRSPQRYRPAGGGHSFPRVAVADGSSKVEGVRFAVQVERLQIAGKVVDDAGQPVPDVRMEAHLDGERNFGMSAIPSAVTDTDGAFVITDLLGGNYLVAARAGNGAETDSGSAIAAGTRDVRLVLTAPGEIEGTLAGFTGTPRIVAYPYGSRRMRFTELTGEIHGSTFRIRGVPAGRYGVVASIRGVRGDEELVEVKPRATAKTTLTYRGVGSISGVVVDGESQTPVAGAHCFGAGARNVRDELSSDAQGRFTIDPAPVGMTFVMCQTRDGRRGHAQVAVARDQKASVSVPLSPPDER
jgi:protocatechuate 3,4-dioxygenase beta subunit